MDHVFSTLLTHSAQFEQNRALKGKVERLNRRSSFSGERYFICANSSVPMESDHALNLLYWSPFHFHQVLADTRNFWHVGNWCIHTGQKYIESPFLGPTKGVEVLNYAREFVDALEKIEKAEVISEASWDLYNMSPDKFSERLNWADTIIFGDVETKCLMLHPDFFNRNKWQGEYVTFPDRFEILRNWVSAGGHFHMNGGWYSFSGEIGKGGWGRSVFHEVLPVVCMQGDDLVESTASYPVRTPNATHPVIENIPFEEIPPILGFNETQIRDGAEAIIEIKAMGSWHPLLAAHSFGSGKVSAFTTSASPHWGINLVKWNKYNQLWNQLFTRL